MIENVTCSINNLVKQIINKDVINVTDLQNDIKKSVSNVIHKLSDSYLTT